MTILTKMYKKFTNEIKARLGEKRVLKWKPNGDLDKAPSLPFLILNDAEAHKNLNINDCFYCQP